MENMTNKNEELEIDLQRLLGVLLSKSWLIGLAGVICAAVVFAYTLFFVQPQYQSKAKFYVNNSSLSSISDVALSSITSADISASRGLVKTYIVILQTRETLNDVIDYAGVSLNYQQLSKMITAQAVDATEIFEVLVTSTDPAEAEKIANAVAYILPNRIKNIIDGTSAKVVEAAVVASRPSSPSYSGNAIMGFLVGLLGMTAVVVVRDLLDVSIREEADITQCCKHPVLATVPDMEHSGKGGYYYGYGEKKKARSRTAEKSGATPELVGGNISFAAAEAYKLLRTKLQFSFVDDNECHVIGLSSAMVGEGKSLTAVNLAYTLSQLGKRVLLIDCDMRRPSLAAKLPIQKAPGLSDFLTRQTAAENLIQLCGIKEDKCAFHVVSSGRIPPNPMELLSSSRMEQTIASLRKKYDYILLDLPPVGEVGDPLAAAKLTDGMLVVVRQHYCSRPALDSAVRQLEFVDAKILGTVFNYISESSAGYGKKYYKKYYQSEEQKPAGISSVRKHGTTGK